ncbi:DUF6894 family protein [Methylobacterium oryzae]|uniref:DUF6894 domain-containing protein n=1 Tax=Methylobacterium oryzae TaxID=334852 RepID=A0ABU7TVH4_9HYPH
MPLFYFHLRNPEGLNRDRIGLELPSLDAAYLEACHTVPEMSADLVRKKLNPVRYAFEIADDSGRLLLEVPFSEILDRGRRPVAPPKTVRAPAASVQMERAAYLISALRAEHAATRDKLAETRRLLAALRSVSAANHGRRDSSEP